jgi:signal transduction histidine kinase
VHRRLSIRTRVAAWCAGLAVLTGAVGVVVTLTITGNGLLAEARRTPRPRVVVTQGSVVGPGHANEVVTPPLGPGALGTRAGRRAEGLRVNHVLDSSRRQGLLTVLALACGAVFAAWWAAGRMLSPIRKMTATAHEVAAPRSGRRIGLDGPSDELHELADTIDQMLDRLDASFDGQRRFVADASHELRTPLAVLVSEVDVALDNPWASSTDLREALDRVRSELQRTSRFVGSLLHLSRAESLSTSVDHDLANSAEQALAIVQRLDLGRPSIEIDLAPAPVVGDPLLLDRMLLNLLENAFRYNVDGGFVRVSTKVVDHASLFEVENSGPVVPVDQVARLFERFRRGGRDEDRRQGSDGSGLGLSIAEVVTRSHGGSITLTARPEGGLLAVVRLPKA